MATKEASSNYGVEYWYQRYINWLIDNPTLLKKYSVLSLVVSIALLVATSIIPLPRTLIAIICAPVGVLLFLVVLGKVFLNHYRNPEHLGIREKYSPKKRRRVVIVLVFLTLAFLVTVSPYIPYSVGGVFMIFSFLCLYNTARRTPEEITLALAGVEDPRDAKIVEIDDEETLEELDADDERETTR